MIKKNWRILLILILSFITIAANFFVGLYADGRLSRFLELSIIIFPILLLLIHSSALMPFWRFLFFVFIASSLGFLSEIIGMKYGVIFGGTYIYDGRFSMIFSVPWFILAYWAFFIYSGYSFSNSFLFWQGKPLPNKNKKDWRRLPSIILFDGLLVTVIDLFMEPLQVKLGLWHWFGGGLYYGIPIGNFLGWFFVAVIVSAIFRSVEYFLPITGKENYYRLYLVPAYGYFVLFASFLFFAIKLEMYSLAWLGSIISFPLVIFNIKLYQRWSKSDSLALPEEIC